LNDKANTAFISLIVSGQGLRTSMLTVFFAHNNKKNIISISGIVKLNEILTTAIWQEAYITVFYAIIN
jgi:hypothetical protein